MDETLRILPDGYLAWRPPRYEQAVSAALERWTRLVGLAVAGPLLALTSYALFVGELPRWGDRAEQLCLLALPVTLLAKMHVTQARELLANRAGITVSRPLWTDRLLEWPEVEAVEVSERTLTIRARARAYAWTVPSDHVGELQRVAQGLAALAGARARWVHV